MTAEGLGKLHGAFFKVLLVMGVFVAAGMPRDVANAGIPVVPCQLQPGFEKLVALIEGVHQTLLCVMEQFVADACEAVVVRPWRRGIKLDQVLLGAEEKLRAQWRDGFLKDDARPWQRDGGLVLPDVKQGLPVPKHRRCRQFITGFIDARDPLGDPGRLKIPGCDSFARVQPLTLGRLVTVHLDDPEGCVKTVLWRLWQPLITRAGPMT